MTVEEARRLVEAADQAIVAAIAAVEQARAGIGEIPEVLGFPAKPNRRTLTQIDDALHISRKRLRIVRAEFVLLGEQG